MPEVSGSGMSVEWVRDQFLKITALCERIATKQEEQDRRIERVEVKLDEVRDKPGKRWDSVITAILTGIIAALVAAYFTIPKV